MVSKVFTTGSGFLALVALFAIACSGRPETSKQVVFRFIDEEGTDLFTTEKISVSRVFQEWRFDNGRMAEGCALVTGEVESFGADGALLGH